MFKLFLDPGHGGSDSGAVGNGLREKDVTLSIAKIIRDILTNEYVDVTVKMSRTGDTFPTLRQRTNDANAWGADFYLSVHINSGGGTGFETFTYPGSTQKYQNIIHDEIIKVIGLSDRGKKQEDLHVLRESHMPAILTECGFIDNASDAAKMKDPAWIHSVARAHVIGLEKAFYLKRKVMTAPNLNQTSSISNKEEDEMFTPSNKALRDAVSIMLQRFSDEKVHGENAISPEWRERFNTGEMTVSDGLALLYIAMYRGIFDQRDGND